MRPEGSTGSVMFDEAPPRARATAGAPAWVMTFADLMSLLMCFFVLLLSFSEMDVSKYKEMAGSLKDAFGVQRDIRAKEPPKGINVIAREFSPGLPEPTQLNVIRQMTTNDLRVNLDLGKQRRRPVPTPSVKDDDAVQKHRPSQAEGLTPAQKQELAKAKALAARRLDEKLAAAHGQAGRRADGVMVERDALEKLRAAQVADERRKKLRQNAKLISDALGREIRAGSVDVETAGQKIIIRVREKASFASGRAELKQDFLPILDRVAKILKGAEGKIIIAGHTDNVPIYTPRFRSNWELSAARAVSVAHAMMLATNIPANRFLVQGFADTEPVANNDTPANRARNRRVEIILQQGEDRPSGKAVSGAASRPRAGQSGLLPAPASRQTGRVGRRPADRPRVSFEIKAAGQQPRELL